MLTIQVSQTPSQNQIKNWWKLRNQTKKYECELKNCGLILKSKKINLKEKKRVEITRYSPSKLLDFGNLVGGCKPLLDAMKNVGLIYDDSIAYIQDTYTQLKCSKGMEKTIVKISEI